MVQRSMAGHLDVANARIRNWKKEKPNLYEIVMKGSAFEEAVKKKAQQNADELKTLEEQFKGKK